MALLISSIFVEGLPALFMVAPHMMATIAYEMLVMQMARIVPFGIALFGS